MICEECEKRMITICIFQDMEKVCYCHRCKQLVVIGKDGKELSRKDINWIFLNFKQFIGTVNESDFEEEEFA